MLRTPSRPRTAKKSAASVSWRAVARGGQPGSRISVASNSKRLSATRSGATKQRGDGLPRNPYVAYGSNWSNVRLKNYRASSPSHSRLPVKLFYVVTFSSRSLSGLERPYRWERPILASKRRFAGPGTSLANRGLGKGRMRITIAQSKDIRRV
jgi:hypothetical protein